MRLWASSVPSALARLLEHAGVGLDLLNWPGEAAPSRLLRARPLAGRLRRADAALLHLFGLAGSATFLAAARRSGTAVVLSPDQLPAGSRQAGRLGRAARLFASVDAIELPSRAAVDRLCAALPELAARVHLVPPGMDVAERAPERIGGQRIAAFAERWQLDPARRLVLVCGAMRRDGPHLVVLQAAAACGRGDFELLFAGDQAAGRSFLPQLRSHVHATGLAERVRFADIRDDPAAAFALADLVLHLPDVEALDPLPLLEAQAAGVPVITASDMGYEEFLLPAVTGWMVPPGDREALASALTTGLALDPGTRERVAARCREFVASTFAPERSIRARFRAYRAVLDGPGVRPADRRGIAASAGPHSAAQ